MITYIAALYAEAKPFIEALQLKKIQEEHRLQLFGSEHCRLLLTGTGEIAAATSVASYFTKYPPEADHILVNVGIAGAVPSASIGALFYISGITEQVTGRTFYPDLLFRHDFVLSHAVTCALPVTSMAELKHSSTSTGTLVDMEAAAIYQAALPYLSTDRMYFFKVVSDLIGESTQEKATILPDRLMSPHVSAICTFAEKIERLLKTEQDALIPIISERQSELQARILERLPLTEAMQIEFTSLLRYASYAGLPIENILSDFYSGLPESIRGKKQAAPYLQNLRECILKTPGTLIKEPLFSEEYCPAFSVAYAEEEVISETSQIPIRHYKDLFNRSHQNFARQKKAPSLIFAKKTGTLIYPGAPVCQSFGNEHFYYTSCMMNCIYHCDYCYLQGMYPSGHTVVFVNLEDYFKELEILLIEHPVYLCVSYDTDLLALENRFHFVSRWIEFAKTQPELTLEIRTKSGNPAVFKELSALYEDCPELKKKLIFAWTLSPKEVCEQIEQGAASLSLRKKALLSAAKEGFPVRLCFDPMICHAGWQENYKTLVQELFADISPDILYDVSIGVFRISTEYLKNMRKNRPGNAVAWYPYCTEHGVSHYGTLSETMVQYMKDLLSDYVPTEKIFIWNGGEE